MAWFVTIEYKDREQGTNWSPQFLPIQSEIERFEQIGGEIGKEIEAKYMAGPRNRQSAEYPAFFISSSYPPLLDGWRWPMPDKPFQMKLKQQGGELIDLIATPFGSWAISQRVIEIIEAIEPGVHGYLPFEIVNPDDSVHFQRRWLLNVCTRAEVVDTEKSNIRWLAAPTDHWFSDQFEGGRLVVNAEEAYKRAIWNEWRFNRGWGPMVSDRLWNALQEENIRGWEPHFGHPTHIEEL